jgi:hypothetical protein
VKAEALLVVLFYLVVQCRLGILSRKKVNDRAVWNGTNLKPP